MIKNYYKIIIIKVYYDSYYFIENNKYYYCNKKLHRLDGPAVSYNFNKKSWYYQGKLLAYTF